MARTFSLGRQGGPNFDGCVPTFDAPVHVTARIQTGRAPAVVLLHGLGDSRLAFEDAFATRYLAGASLIVPDMAGHGGSPAALDYSMEAAARRVRHVLDHLVEHHGLRISRLYLVGHSVGGIPATFFCRDAAPGEVAGLILAEASVTRFGAFVSAHAEAARLSGRFGEWYAEFRDQTIFRDYLGKFPFCRHYYASLRFCREEAFLQTVLAVRRASRALPGKWSHAAGDALLSLSLPKLYAYGRDVAPETRAFLDEHAVPTRPFPTDCHFLMQAMPGEFYSMLGEFCQ
ncbi:MAG: putative hydrolase or acyltransferase of alpha/beta superfamily [Solidesulfovibrio magneticus str. Maddingley MBC34]|uniref:Putative hydrolase or acyltransferase of alpha/beta superfamily n=1 Tax=Solidesulfovibrio magneticus str. Maddingley MBC34 TaxID=1206767 RepID=K6H4E8_9BACT|nr:MAG: putative hydrolase or acyltransferase of alpha/beta superfamily [Solidesulfovibrio magneticus str. Maddingley MBC34]